MSSEKSYSKGEWVLAGVLLVLAAIGYFWWESGSDERAQQAEINRAKNERDWAKFGGLRKCRKAISSLAAYGKEVDPGSTGGVIEDGVVFFVWPRGSFHFQNAFGADVPQSAVCEVDEETGDVIRLTVSGKVVFQR